MGLFDGFFSGQNQNRAQPGTVHPGTGSHQGAAPPPPPPQNPTGNPGAPDLNRNPGADPKNLPPNGSANPNNEPISPLDQFKDLWKTPTVDPKAPGDPLTQPLLQNDPAKFAEAVKNLDFTKGIDPEVMTKALAGDTQAFMDVLNHTNRQAFAAATQLSTQATESAVRTNNGRLTPAMEKKFKEYLTNTQRSENPIFNHPAAAPMLDMAKKQLLVQHPDKTPEEIHAMAEDYLSEFATAMNGSKKEESGPRRENAETDFSDWLN